MYTEEEAKEKWCPFAMEAGDGDGFGNRNYDGDPMNGTCLGDDCMAWRWKGKGMGYCGLAGKP